MEQNQFDDASIQRLFGHEAAEDENPHRLRDYYFKGNVYQRASSDLPLRLLVGHKGIGKSALFQVARQEDADAGILAIMLRPDDVYEITTSASLLESIRKWKDGLARIIADRAIEILGTKDDNAAGTYVAKGVGIRPDFRHSSLNTTAISRGPRSFPCHTFGFAWPCRL